MTVAEFIEKLQIFANASPLNGRALLCVGAPGGQTCFAEFNALNGVSPRHNILVLSPIGGEFQMIDKPAFIKPN